MEQSIGDTVNVEFGEPRLADNVIRGHIRFEQGLNSCNRGEAASVFVGGMTALVFLKAKIKAGQNVLTRLVPVALTPVISVCMSPNL